MTWHICDKINYFLFISSTYLPLFLLKFWAGGLIGCGIKFHIQWVPTLHTCDEPGYPKKNTWKMWWWHHHHFFQVFLIFGVAGSIKSMQCGYSLDVELNSDPTSSLAQNLSKNIGRYVENTNKKSSFILWQICQFNHYGWLILLKFYWFLNSNSQNLFLARFFIRPILDPKFPLMHLAEYARSMYSLPSSLLIRLHVIRW